MTWTADDITRFTKLSKQQIHAIGAAAVCNPNCFYDADLMLLLLCDVLKQLGFNDNDLNAIADTYCAELVGVYSEMRQDDVRVWIFSIADNRYATLMTSRGEDNGFYDIKERVTVKTIPAPLLSLSINVRRLYERSCVVLQSLRNPRVAVSIPPALPSAEADAPKHNHPLQ